MTSVFGPGPANTLAVNDELAQRLTQERAKHAELDRRYAQLVTSEGEVLTALQARSTAAMNGLAALKKERVELEAAVPRLQKQVRNLSSGLWGLRRYWVRLGEPTVSAVAPLVSLMLFVAGQAVPLHIPFLHAAPIAGALGGLALAVASFWRPRP